MTGIDMDGKHYRVRLIFGTLEESFRLPDGPNAGDMLSGRHERDLAGTYYSHSISVEPDPRYPQDYDQFFRDISAPVQSHQITMPDGQGTMTYEAMVSSGSHKSNGKMGGVRRWSGLTVYFEAIKPQRPAQ